MSEENEEQRKRSNSYLGHLLQIFDNSKEVKK